ncbi:MAG: hypothetical protein ACK5MJ_00365 [Alphaproteobacteria bacterium]
MNFKHIVITSFLFLTMMLTAQAETYHLSYKARSGIVNLGNSFIYVEASGNSYNIRMDRNLSWPGVLNEQSTTVVSGNTKGVNAYPQSYVQTRTGRELTRTTKINWNNGMPSVRMNPPIETRAETVLDITSAKNSIDPLSTIYRVMRDVTSNGGCTGNFVSFDGFSSISTILQPLNFKSVSTSAYNGEATGCRLQMRGKSGLIMGGKRVGQATNMDIWLAHIDGSPMAVPVLIQTKEGAKSVSLRLVDFLLSN